MAEPEASAGAARGQGAEADSLLLVQRAEQERDQTQEKLEQKTAELASSVAVLRATLEATTDGIVVTDAAGQVQAFNEHYVKLWQVPRQLLHTADHWHILAELAKNFADPQEFLARIREIYTDSPPQSYDVLSLTDGRVIERFSKALIVAEQNLGRVFSFRDVTAQRRSEEALRDETRILEVLNQTGSALASNLELQTLLQAVTDAATKLSSARFGAFFYNVTNEAGDAFMLFTLSGAPRAPFERLGHPRATALFAPTFRGEGVIRCADVLSDPRFGQMAPHHGMPPGHLPVRSYLAVPVVSRSQEVIGGLFFGHPEVGVFTERTERLVVGIAAQAAIALDNARLYNEAQSAISALERSNKELDQFAYVTSHDLKAPLRGIASLAEWIEEDTGPQLPSEARRHLELLRGRVRRMEGLIQGILELSRAGRVRVQPELVDVGALLAEVVDLLQPVPPARVELAPELPRLYAERLPLSQVFSNLISNSLKHAGRPDVTIRISSDDDGDSWRFTIADNGRGIPAPYRERVFELFQTLEARDRVESTGIGLSIVRKVVEGRGGRVWIDDAPAGATFRFTWPKKATSAPPPKL